VTYGPDRARRTAFCTSYDIAEPRLRLRDIAHWAAVAPDHGSGPHDDVAYVVPGYFYLPVSETPDDQQVHEWLTEAGPADWVLVPSVPNRGVVRWSGRAVVSVPFLPVAYFRVTGTLDACLRATVGGGQYKDMVRLTRKAEQLCRSEFHRLSDLPAGSPMLEDFADLQARNVAKYGHIRNLYRSEVLRELTGSAGDRYYLKVDYDRASGVPLYGSLSYADEQRGVFSQLVQGQDRDRVPAGLNLYVSDYYQLYRAADVLGFRSHCLGRGAVDAKRRLGANDVVDLVNVLIPVTR
jgi:hypothetical protein